MSAALLEGLKQVTWDIKLGFTMGERVLNSILPLRYEERSYVITNERLFDFLDAI